ncbi:permease prefix domain 1-containing protein, partial [Alicyclobacillus acidoterrestris]
MKNFDNYFFSVFKGTYLSKREKQVWQEEMQDHLEESIEQAIKRGLTEEEAHASAFASFGTAREVRRRIIRETYGMSPRWFLTLSLLCLMVFVISLFVQMRMNDVIPSTLKPIPTPRWVVFWSHNLTPFCIVWLIGRMTHEFSMNSVVFAGYPIMAPVRVLGSG